VRRLIMKVVLPWPGAYVSGAWVCRHLVAVFDNHGQC